MRYFVVSLSLVFCLQSGTVSADEIDHHAAAIAPKVRLDPETISNLESLFENIASENADGRRCHIECQSFPCCYAPPQVCKQVCD